MFLFYAVLCLIFIGLGRALWKPTANQIIKFFAALLFALGICSGFGMLAGLIKLVAP
jgi:phosphoribosylformylglycinamidine (FGAM) synthase-like amidotransferase family enzyme